MIAFATRTPPPTRASGVMLALTIGLNWDAIETGEEAEMDSPVCGVTGADALAAPPMPKRDARV